MSDIIQLDQVIVWVVCVIVLVGSSCLLERIWAHRIVDDTMVILAYNYNLFSLVPLLV